MKLQLLWLRHHFWEWLDRHLHTLARQLPNRLLYWCVITAWARSTSGRWAKMEATNLTIPELLTRLEWHRYTKGN